MAKAKQPSREEIAEDLEIKYERNVDYCIKWEYFSSLSPIEAIFLMFLEHRFPKLEEDKDGTTIGVLINEKGYFRCTDKDIQTEWDCPPQFNTQNISRVCRSLSEKGLLKVKRLGIPGKRWIKLTTADWRSRVSQRRFR